MQKKILGLGMVALLAFGLMLSGCKDDAGGPPPEVWTGDVLVTGTGTAVNYGSAPATLTLTGSDWHLVAKNLDKNINIDEQGTFTVLGEIAGIKSMQILQENKPIGTASILDNVLSFGINYNYPTGTISGSNFTRQ
jgi:hypothetical protein